MPDDDRTMTPVADDDPMLIAWKEYQNTDGFTITSQWAGNPKHLEGSLWAIFSNGWKARAAFEDNEKYVLVHNEGCEAVMMKLVAGTLDRSGRCPIIKPAHEEIVFIEDDFSGGIAFDRWQRCKEYFESAMNRLHIKMIKPQ